MHPAAAAAAMNGRSSTRGYQIFNMTLSSRIAVDPFLFGNDR
jgi:hypothetical protein